MRALLLATALLVAVLGTCSIAWSQGLPEEQWSAEVAATNAGSNSWTYVVRNTSPASGYVIWLVAIEVDDQASVTKATSPAGWTVDTESQPHFITWMYYAGEIQAGGSQSGFTAQFDNQPAYQRYTAFFNNAETDERPYVEGFVIAPEPASAVSLLVGLAPAAALALRKRRTSAR